MSETMSFVESFKTISNEINTEIKNEVLYTLRNVITDFIMDRMRDCHVNLYMGNDDHLVFQVKVIGRKIICGRWECIIQYDISKHDLNYNTLYNYIVGENLVKVCDELVEKNFQGAKIKKQLVDSHRIIYTISVKGC